MATVAPSTDCRRRAVLTAALSRTSAAVLFLGVIVVGAVASARWITSTTAVSSSNSRLSDDVGPSAEYLYLSMTVANYANNFLSMTERERERERESSRALCFWDESSTRHRRRRVWVCSILGVWDTFLFLSPFLLSSAHLHIASQQLVLRSVALTRTTGRLAP
jgi:hypothetical protein